ncbi:MAG: ABC transporter permease subunit, partial [Treponema sp.]|nr:ABC transporter permease subunit [Treponema sp.]
AFNLLLERVGLLDFSTALPPDWLGSGFVGVVVLQALHLFPILYLNASAALANVDPAYQQAARNLGAKNLQVFMGITLPLITPAVLSGILLSFAMSFDDVIISVFVTGPQTNTLPIRIYSQIKTGITPKTNALCALLFTITVILCILAAMVLRIKPADSADPAKSTTNERSL